MGYDTFDQLCKMKGVTAYQVAKVTGVSTATLSSWKSGRYTPKDEKLQKLAEYFGVSAQYLRTGDEQERYGRYKELAEKIHRDLEHRSALGITDEEWDLLSAFRYLNDVGQKKALIDIIDLTEIKKYRKNEYKEGYIRY